MIVLPAHGRSSLLGPVLNNTLNLLAQNLTASQVPQQTFAGSRKPYLSSLSGNNIHHEGLMRSFDQFNMKFLVWKKIVDDEQYVAHSYDL